MGLGTSKYARRRQKKGVKGSYETPAQDSSGHDVFLSATLTEETGDAPFCKKLIVVHY
jgi:hypothetical protein